MKIQHFGLHTKTIIMDSTRQQKGMHACFSASQSKSTSSLGDVTTLVALYSDWFLLLRMTVLLRLQKLIIPLVSLVKKETRLCTAVLRETSILEITRGEITRDYWRFAQNQQDTMVGWRRED